MRETDPSRQNTDENTLLRDAINLLTEEVRLQKELMGVQNARFEECRQQLEAQADEAHRARQEALLHRTLLERQKSDFQDLQQLHQNVLLDLQQQLGLLSFELTQARRQLNTRFWRYTRPLRGLLGLFDPKA